MVSPLRKVFALKRIRLNGLDGDTAQGFADEIQLLRRLQGKENIIQLIDAEVLPCQDCTHRLCLCTQSSCSILSDSRCKVLL